MIYKTQLLLNNINFQEYFINKLEKCGVKIYITEQISYLNKIKIIGDLNNITKALNLLNKINNKFNNKLIIN